MNSPLTSRLSKLQRFILLEAAKSLPKLEEKARGITAWMAPFRKPGSKPFEASDLEHITRTEILTKFFKLTMRKHRMWTGKFFGSWETDSDTSQISASAAGRTRYNSNASLYRAVRRLEQRGLIVRMPKQRGNMQLTQKGILAAEMLQSLKPFSGREAIADTRQRSNALLWQTRSIHGPASARLQH